MLAMARTEERKTVGVTCVVPAVETLVLTWKLLSVSSVLWSNMQYLLRVNASLSKEEILTQLRIGHTCLTHQYLFPRSDPPVCPCGENLSFKHILPLPMTHRSTLQPF